MASSTPNNELSEIAASILRQKSADSPGSEHSLLQDHEKYTLLTELMTDVVWILDMNLRTFYVSPSIRTALGFTPEERLEHDLKSQVTPASLSFLLDVMAKELALEQQGQADPNRTVTLELELYHKDGSTRWFELLVKGVRDDKGAPLGIHGVSRDITRRKRAESEQAAIFEALRASEQKYRFLLEQMRDIVWTLDTSMKLTYVSQAVTSTLGFTAEELLLRHLSEMTTPETYGQAISLLARETEVQREGNAAPDRSVVIEMEHHHRDGHTRWLESRVHALMDSDGRVVGLHGVSRDITDRKRAEAALRNSEAKFSALVESSPSAIFLIQGTRYIYINPAFEKIVGYTMGDLAGMNFWDLVHPDYADLVKSRGLGRLQGENPPSRYEVKCVAKNGQAKCLDCTSIAIVLDKMPTILGTAQEITEQKHAETKHKLLQERLLQAEKMETLGLLAGGVAHDLNNVLGALSGYSELLMMQIPEKERARKYVERILQSTEKGAAIVEDLLTLTRRGVNVADVINLNTLVSGFLKSPVLEKMKDFHPHVTFRTECSDGLMNIKGSPSHLEKTIMNIVSNAAESISGQGEVTIKTRNVYLDQTIPGCETVREGQYVALSISDTGSGISADSRKKIFEPFYTKKVMGRSGTGLGLAIVWGVVKDNNGHIDVQSEIGEGTTFTLYFPATEEQASAPPDKIPMKQYMGNGESVLVIDDVAEQRDVATELLTRLGYKVHSIASGEEAVEYLRNNMADILVLDMIMAPTGDGLETYQKILEINPKQKAVLVSGLSETDRVRSALELGAGAYVKKPYRADTIGTAIRDELKRGCDWRPENA